MLKISLTIYNTITKPKPTHPTKSALYNMCMLPKLLSLPSYDTVTQWANSIVILKKVRPVLTDYIFYIQYKKKSAQCWK